MPDTTITKASSSFDHNYQTTTSIQDQKQEISMKIAIKTMLTLLIDPNLRNFAASLIEELHTGGMGFINTRSKLYKATFL